MPGSFFRSARASSCGIARSRAASSWPSRAARATDRSHSGLRPASPGNVSSSASSLRGREGVHHPAAEADRLAEPLGHPRLDRRRLGDADPVPDDGPGRRLVRGPEADRPQARVLRLDLADHRVALAHRGEPRAVHVERQDPFELRAYLRDQVRARLGRADDLGGHRAAVVLPHPDAGGPPAALDTERQLEHAAGPPEYDAGVKPSRNPMLAASENGPRGTRVNVSMRAISSPATDISGR